MATASTEPRITLHPHAQRVQVTIDGTGLADTTRAIELRERGYPLRQYTSREDVRMDLLTPSATVTHCPFKGDATYTPLVSTRTSRGVMRSRWKVWRRMQAGWRFIGNSSNDCF